MEKNIKNSGYKRLTISSEIARLTFALNSILEIYFLGNLLYYKQGIFNPNIGLIETSNLFPLRDTVLIGSIITVLTIGMIFTFSNMKKMDYDLKQKLKSMGDEIGHP